MNIVQFFRNAQGVLGMNARNLEYIARFNPGRAIVLANDKLKTKDCLTKAGLVVSSTLLTITHPRQINTINWDSLPPSFVIKPASSSQGRGVLVIFGKSKKRPDTWIRSDGRRITKEEIASHLFTILVGSFSEGADKAFFEERVKVHPSLKPYARRGTPDVRVIVFNKVPIMAELRLPTLRSGGRSNLHMGGIGIGVDLAQGITTHAIYLGKPLRFLPDTRTMLSGVTIPAWDKVLLSAVQAQEAMGLGFAGIDIGIDNEGSPIIFEVNAQPGLAIQNANLSGLRQHLERIKGLRIKNARQGVSIAQALSGENVTKQLEIISGKKVLGIFEPIQIETAKGLWPITAKLDTGAYSSSIDRELLKKLGVKKDRIYQKKIKSALGEEIRDFATVAFYLRGERIQTEASVAERAESRYDVLIGRKDLKGFLLDPAQVKPKIV